MKRFIRRNVAEVLCILAGLAIVMLAFNHQAHAADTYTPDLRIVQMPTGSNDTQWGIKANAAFAMLEQGIAGGTTISVTSGDLSLTTANNASDQARNAVIAFTGTPGVTRNVTMPNVSKLTWVVNASNASITFTAGAGIASTVGSGNVALIYTDGATNANLLTNISSFSATFLAAGTQSAQQAALGLGTAATHAATDFMQGANNLSELTNAGTARIALGLTAGTTAQTALGLGTASLAAASATSLPLAAVTGTVVSGNVPVFSGTAGTIADSGIVLSGFLTKAGNLSGLANTTQSRSNLGDPTLGNVPVSHMSTGTPTGSGTNIGDIWLRVQ